MKANQRLRRERELRGWSQARVAGEIGTDPATVSRWERGLSFPYPYFREKLCALFEKNAEELGLVQDESAGGPAQRHYIPTHERAGAPLFVEPLHDPSIPLPSTVGPGLVGRDDMLSWLKQRLCTGDSVGLTALNGLPGVGKTALAVQLAHDKEVLDHFSDGVLWAALGPRPNVVAQLSRWRRTARRHGRRPFVPPSVCVVCSSSLMTPGSLKRRWRSKRAVLTARFW